MAESDESAAPDSAAYLLLVRLWWGLVAAAFILAPFVAWYLVLAGRMDMSRPIRDVYIDPKDPPPATVRAALRYGGLTLWTALSLGLAYLLLQGWIKALRLRSARRRGDIPPY